DAASPETDLPAPDTVMAQRSDTASEVLGGEDGESAPVLILPSGVEGQAPTIVQPEAEQLALLQSPGEELTGVRLDRISYAAGGFVDLIGRAGPGNTVRVYVNADFAGQAVTVPAGQWRLVLPGSRVREAVLLRFDEVAPNGSVVGRIETPFTYERTAGPKTLGKRSIEIEKGDYLWRIAEQYYGEGIRYSLIFSANSGLIRDPDLIYPGQVFTLPALIDSE
ncbi:MAG: LysM peptidoglycan-binding domain-containing protein, partial [Pseudomonadota bacterium]